VGLSLRAGLHTGEIEMRGADIGGIAVHAAARRLRPRPLRRGRPALRTPTTPHAGLLPAATTKVQMNPGLSLWLDESRGQVSGYDHEQPMAAPFPVLKPTRKRER
jgi:hypothetical protein